MSRILLSCFLILLSFVAFSQNFPCQKLKEGRFMIKNEQTGTTIITREGSIQREENEKLGAITEDKIEWITDCKYKLIPLRVVKNTGHLDFSKDLKLVIEITQINKSSYVQTTTSEITGDSVSAEVIILDKK